MTDVFHERIRKSLGNAGLQAALDANAERRVQARMTAFISLPEDLQSMRRRAHMVRAEVISHLDEYLEQFIAKAEANGMQVHRAADAQAARQIILEIVRQKQAGMVAKSKTMVGEEIEINGALEAAGIQAVETDLGEYIVQLRGEPPAHIITPAVHLSRQDVGRLFAEKLGLPYTEDIAAMTAVARRTLRQVFLSAEVGISGVNFGVAESGTLCLVTNEGNGRMCTTLPPVHIALMGMERLVPTLDELALMLYLLPRSATGQKLSVYTSLIHGPRREGELDGPIERHLVLVDNGRSALRGSPLEEALYCIRCGACLNACPVFREIGGHAYVSVHGVHTPYPGPIGSVLTPGLLGQAEFGGLARASSLCGACKEACPVDIDLPKLLLRVRAGGMGGVSTAQAQHASRGLRWALKIFAWAATSPRRFAMAQRLAGLLGRVWSPGSEWMAIPAFTGWGYSRDLPRPATRSFTRQGEAEGGNTKDTKDEGEGNTKDAKWTKGAERMGTEEGEAEGAGRGEGVEEEKAEYELARRFAGELAALGGICVTCEAGEVSERVRGLLKERGIDVIQAWGEQELPEGLLDRLRVAGVRVHQAADPETRAGLTGALAAAAETGTLVLASGAGRPQTASLLPELHVAILRAGDIKETLAQVLKLRKVREASSAVLISGPSRTADIEMTLTIGVHGPGELYVFCIA